MNTNCVSLYMKIMLLLGEEIYVFTVGTLIICHSISVSDRTADVVDVVYVNM